MKKLFLALAVAACAVCAAHTAYEETVARYDWTCTYCSRTYVYEDLWRREYRYDNYGDVYWIGNWYLYSKKHVCARCGRELDWNGEWRKPEQLLAEDRRAAEFNAWARRQRR